VHTADTVHLRHRCGVDMGDDAASKTLSLGSAHPYQYQYQGKHLWTAMRQVGTDHQEPEGQVPVPGTVFNYTLNGRGRHRQRPPGCFLCPPRCVRKRKAQGSARASPGGRHGPTEPMYYGAYAPAHGKPPPYTTKLGPRARPHL